MEAIVKEATMEFLEQGHLISDLQHGFRQNRSCLSSLLLSTEQWTRALDEDGRVDVIYTDFKKAFDSVPHKRLIYKLSEIGIRGTLLTWITDFLTGRSQTVCIEASKSTPIPVLSGVPQGSVLGPLLFLVYINDCVDNLGCSAIMFADDVKLWRPIRSDADRKADSTGIDSTKDHFRQLADDIRESWGNILASASIPSVATCVGIQKPFTTSRPNEDTTCRLPTTCSVSKLSTDMSRLRENTTDSQGYNSCGLLRTPSSREQTEASLASRITAMANLLTSAASQGFKRSPRTLTNQSFPNNSNFRSTASSRGCNTDPTLTNSPVPNGPNSFGAGNISQGDARTQTSDVLRPTSSSNRGVEVLPTVSSNSRLSSGLSATPMPSADSSTVGSSNDVANANFDWRHSSSQHSEKPSLLGHYNSATDTFHLRTQLNCGTHSPQYHHRKCH
nr:unnamed protein product [Spirometra erinaceieuropaei]